LLQQYDSGHLVKMGRDKTIPEFLRELYFLVDTWYIGTRPEDVDANAPSFLDMLFSDYQNCIEQFLAQPAPFKLRLALDNTDGIELIGNKLLLYAHTSLLVIQDNDEDRLYAGGWGNEDDSAPLDDTFFPLNPARFFEALVCLRPAIEAGHILVLPERLFYEKTPVLPPGTIPEMYGAQLRSELLEQHQEGLNGVPSMEFTLPHLKGLPLQEMLAFRGHNAVHFTTFHKALHETASRIREFCSGNCPDSVLLEILQEVDYNVRLLEDVHQRERRRSVTLAAYELVFLAGGVVLYDVVPQEVYKLLIAALGGATVKSVMDRLIKPTTQIDSPFYIPWKLHRKTS
jgi:hypothetical protein